MLRANGGLSKRVLRDARLVGFWGSLSQQFPAIYLGNNVSRFFKIVRQIALLYFDGNEKLKSVGLGGCLPCLSKPRYMIIRDILSNQGSSLSIQVVPIQDRYA